MPADYRARSTEATAKGVTAFERLLTMAETRDSGQIRRIASFIGGVWNGLRHFDLFDLRAVDVEISDDMLAVLDALRWGKLAVEDMVPHGSDRIKKVLDRWGMLGSYPEEQRGQVICVPRD